MAVIFHITTRDEWNRSEGTYRSENFTIDGFIHCSTREQVIQVANARFRGQTGLVLLSIDTAKVIAEILYENLEGGQELFPHIYGELNSDAVVQFTEFGPAANGYFTLPSSLG